MVARTSFISCRLAPSTAKPMGIPCPSVSRLRLTPRLPRSVGFGPVFFPPERCFRHRAIHAQPVPINPVQFSELLYPSVPELQKDLCLHPLLKAVVGGGLGTEVGMVQGCPLPPGTEDENDGVGTAAVGDARAAATKAMRIHPHGDERLEDRPEFIRDTKPGGGAVVGRSRPGALGWCWLCVHAL